MNKETEQRVITSKKEYDFDGEIEKIKEILKSFESCNLNDEQKNHLMRSTFLCAYIVMEDTIKHYINNFHDKQNYTFYDLNENFRQKVIKEKTASINKIYELLNNGNKEEIVSSYNKFISEIDIKIGSVKQLQEHFDLMEIGNIYLDDEKHVQKNICEYIKDLNSRRINFAHKLTLENEYSKEKLEEDISLIEQICNKIRNKVNKNMPQ